MSNASALGAVEYEVESTFGENVSTFATHRIPIASKIDLSGLKHDKIESDRVVQRLQDGTPHILGAQEGSFKLKMWAAGHGSTTAGTPTVDAVETFLAYVFGTPASNGTLSGSASTTLTGGTAAVPLTTASATFPAGGMAFIGALGDARGNGQAVAIATHVTTTMTLLTAIDGAPSNGDVLYPTVAFMLPEDATAASTTVLGLRFRVRTANLAVELHGCYPTAVTLGGTNTGDIPFWEVTFGIAWWQYTATSGVSSVTQNQYNPAPVAAGSLFVAAVGTSTRTKRTCRSFSVSIALGVVPLLGPGGANAYQKIVGAKRVPSKIAVHWTEDADAATATPALDGFYTGTTRYHALYTLSTTPGSRVALYFRNLAITAPRPMQMDDGGVNRIAIDAIAYTSSTTTSELTLSAMTIAYA